MRCPIRYWRESLLQLCSIIHAMSVQPGSPEAWSQQGVCLLPSFFVFSPFDWYGLLCYANASDSYIKELADRIHSIENKLESEGSLTQDEIDRLLTPGSHRAYNGLVPPEEPGRKRTFSSISASDFNAAAPRQAPWGPEPRPILPAPASSDTFTGPGYANNSLAPQPAAVKAETAPPKPPVASMDSQVVETEEVPEVDEDSLHE